MLAMAISGGILLLLLLLLLAPLTLCFAYAGGILALKARYLFFIIDLSPEGLEKLLRRGEKKPSKQKPEPPPEEAETPEKPAKKRGLDETLELISIILRATNGPMAVLRRHLVLYRVRLYALICGGDAHITALKYAEWSAAIFNLLAVLGQAVVLRQPTVFLMPDFTGKESKLDFSARLRIRPLFILAAGLHFAVRFIRFHSGKKKATVKGGKKHEPTASRQ